MHRKKRKKKKKEKGKRRKKKTQFHRSVSPRDYETGR